MQEITFHLGKIKDFQFFREQGRKRLYEDMQVRRHQDVDGVAGKQVTGMRGALKADHKAGEAPWNETAKHSNATARNVASALGQKL